MINSILIGGHRGSGCTDSTFARSLNITKVAENTIPSILLAIKNGAVFIEIDAIQTADNHIVVTHSNNLADHIFGVDNIGFVGDKTLAEIKQLKTGVNSDGVIPTLKEVLEITKDITLHIEIKDVKGTAADKFIPNRPTVPELLVKELAGYKGKVLFSSFSIWDLEQMQKLLPNTPRAMLFDSAEKTERPIYPDSETDNSIYQHFNVQNISNAYHKASISYVHPCLNSLNDEAIAHCASLGLGVNTWAMNEPLPQNNKQLLDNAINLAQTHKLPFAILTDHVPELKAYLKQ